MVLNGGKMRGWNREREREKERGKKGGRDEGLREQKEKLEKVEIE